MTAFGGPVIGGPVVRANVTGKPERVLSSEQWAALARLAKS